MTGRRSKSVVLLAAIGSAGLALLAWTQPWFVLELATGQALEVRGDAAAGALAPLALSALALVAALAIAGPVFRVILAVLGAALGALVVWSGSTALADPVGAAATAVTAATGVAGDRSVRDLVESAQSTPWPVTAIAAGVLLVGASVAVFVTSRRWPASSRRYQTARFESADSSRSTVSDWDSLSDGHDPTSAPRDDR